MAPRPAWKGYLKLSLVTCAVELSGATTQSEKISFRTLNRNTGNAVRRQYIDQTTGKPVTEKNEVRGYEIEKDEYLLIEDEDLETVQIESSHTLNLDSFVEKADVETGWVYPVPEETRAYGFSQMMRHFVDHFVAGTSPDETFEDGVVVNRIIDACYASMTSGVWERVAA